MTTCRKCGSCIPQRMVIDGKVRALSSRKFCLTCSPYKNHNTRADDPSKKPVTINRYLNWSSEYKKRHIARNTLKGVLARERAIKEAGGKCVRCGYDRGIRNMHFHHRNPQEKLFGISAVNIKNKPWDEVANEIKKCDLLCSNCHGEEEDKLSRERFLKDNPRLESEVMPTMSWGEILSIVGRRTTRKRTEYKLNCVFCGKDIMTRRHVKFCSKICANEGKRKSPIPLREELEVLRANEMSWDDIGKKYGVKRTAVMKWAKHYGLPTRHRARSSTVECLPDVQ